MANMVEVKNVTKKFKHVTALKDVSITFEQGKIHGVIGRNGSGKTVMFKCICGFMEPSAGEIFVNGKRVVPARMQDIGIIIEDPGFIPGMNAFKNLKLLASIHHKIKDDHIKDVIRQVGLDPDSKQPAGKFSLGMRHRLGIAQAIMENPPLLILDEPMNGLDKNGVLEMRTLLRKLCDENGTTIIMSSHYAEDIEALCDTVCEMDGGVLTKIRGHAE